MHSAYHLPPTTYHLPTPVRIRTLALLFFGGMLAGVWDASIVSWFPSPLSAFRLVLPFAIAFSLFNSRKAAILFAIVGGCALAVLLPSTGGFIPVRYALCVIIAYELSRHVFADRTLFGVSMLASIAAASDRIMQWGFEAGTRLLSGTAQTPEAGGPILAEILWFATIAVLAFISLAAFTRRFLPTISHYAGRQLR
jgi:hypothetical protein